MKQSNTELNRSMSLPIITFYGLGTIIGAGIYVLIGKVAAAAGLFLPLSFLIAGVLAIFTAMSYAELSSRFPKSAGAALYVQEAWSRQSISRIIGGLLVLTGIVSAATMANGFVGYLGQFIDLAEALSIILFVCFLSFVAAWGIKESAFLITFITLVEICGLFFVLYTGQHAEPVMDWSSILSVPETAAWSGIALGSFLAFYAFIGFEDMVNVVEEVQDPKRNLPIAMMLAIILATLLYCIVGIIAVRTVPVDLLADSKAPLADMVKNAGYSPLFISVISLVAVINGALVQIIMASRVIYGMGKQGMIPQGLSYLHPKRKTPILATVLVSSIVLISALWFPLVTLAKITSFMMLVIFTCVNLALVVVKRRTPAPEGVYCFHIFVPLIGAALCVILLILQMQHIFECC